MGNTAVSMMANGRIVQTLSTDHESEVFLIFTTQLYSYLCNLMQYFSYIGKREVFQQEYSIPQYSPLLTSGGYQIEFMRIER